MLVVPKWQERALVSAQLQEEGYRVKSFHDLEAAAAYLCHAPSVPDLVVLDLKGIAYSPEKLKAFRLLIGEIPLVLCTSPYSRDPEAEKVLGPAQVLVRPFAVKDVVEAVKKLVPPSSPNS